MNNQSSGAQYQDPRVVLVTGGTRGLGKAIGLAFAQTGATVFLTHRWGSVDEDALRAEFTAAGVVAPYIIESDVSDAEATQALMQTIKTQANGLDIVISNVAFSKTVQNLADLNRRGMERSLAYSAWPVVDLVQAAQAVFGRFPRYVIGISSDGGEVCHPAYDLAGVSKAVLETLCRYLALRLKTEGTRVNALRPGFLDTASARNTFGEAALAAIQAHSPALLLDPTAVANVCLALCSGLMDAVTGQVIVVDEGWSLVSPLAYITGEGLPGPFAS